jgi:hypothetical protein
LSGGEIAGIVIGSIVFVGVGVVAIYFCVRAKAKVDNAAPSQTGVVTTQSSPAPPKGEKQTGDPQKGDSPAGSQEQSDPFQIDM